MPEGGRCLGNRAVEGAPSAEVEGWDGVAVGLEGCPS